jgi:hypothetical protein
VQLITLGPLSNLVSCLEPLTCQHTNVATSEGNCLEARPKLGQEDFTVCATLQVPDVELCFSLWAMGGTHLGKGNSTPASEFNIWCDPEAAAIAFERVPEITMVSFECTQLTATSISDWWPGWTSQVRCSCF